MKTHIALAGIALTSLACADSPLPDFVLHEWGTFTSVSGSDGVLLPGLQAEEEELPRFVESHHGMENSGSYVGKGWRRPLANVTVKMETPVIYFYTKAAFAAQVKVGFHGGSISQWFPRRSGGEVPPAQKRDETTRELRGGEIDFGAARYEGSIAWDVKVTPTGDDASARVFKPGATPNWLYPRQTDSALVSTANGDTEKFLFYRGVGNFALPVAFTAPDDGTVQAANKGDSAVRGGLVFQHLNDGRARFATLGEVPACGAATVHLAAQPAVSDWQRPVYEAMASQLVAAGLYRKEADAMIQTWWKSYFETPGLRVFWIVPAKTTEAILPLGVTPAPTTQTRVLVGRSEILAPEFERMLIENFAKPPTENPLRYDRFFEPYAARVKVLAREH